MRCFKTMAVPPPPPPALALPACHVVEHSGTRSLTSSGKWKPPVIQPKQLSSVELKEEVCKYVERKLRNEREAPAGYSWLSVFRPVQSILQDGPMCGLVALSMAVSAIRPGWCDGSEQIASPSSIDCCTASLLDHARSEGYSLNGEMFSVDWLGALASHCCGLQAVTCSTWSDPSSIVSNLLSGKLLLVPYSYDTDKNHTPFLAGGHKAHWALITGLVQAHSKQCELFKSMGGAEHMETSCNNILQHAIDGESVHSVNSLPPCSCTGSSSLTERQSVCYVVSRHGKSRYTAIWKLSDLAASNAQLNEMGSELNDSQESSYLSPTSGVREGLCGKAVWIFSGRHGT